jgi:hypothetical protein
MGAFVAVRKGLAGLCNLDMHCQAESYPELAGKP